MALRTIPHVLGKDDMGKISRSMNLLRLVHIVPEVNTMNPPRQWGCSESVLGAQPSCFARHLVQRVVATLADVRRESDGARTGMHSRIAVAVRTIRGHHRFGSRRAHLEIEVSPTTQRSIRRNIHEDRVRARNQFRDVIELVTDRIRGSGDLIFLLSRRAGWHNPWLIPLGCRT